MNQLRVLALGALCALMVSAALPTREANALPLALLANGSGSETPGGCTNTTCAATVNAAIIGKFIGKSTMTLDLTILESGADNGSGGTCVTATGSGQINTANKSAITFDTVGAICNVGGTGTPLTYNATYFISGGTNHFPGAAGAGLFVASINSGNAIVTLSGGLIK